MTARLGALPGSPKATFQYDLLNRQTDVTDPNGTTRHTVYNPLNRILSVTDGYQSPQPLTTGYTYSGLGDLTCVQLPQGNAIEYVYDSAGRLLEVHRKADCCQQDA